MSKETLILKERLSRRHFLKAVGVGAGALALLGPADLLTAQTTEPIRIGVLVPLLADQGNSANRGAFVARDEINANDAKVLGRPIQLATVDDQLLPQGGVQGFTSLVNDQQSLMVVGEFLDEVMLAIMPTISQQGVPFLNTGSATPQTSLMVKQNYDQFKFYFRVMLNSDTLSDDTINMAAGLLKGKMGLTKVAILAEDGQFGRDYQQLLETKLPSVGMSVAQNASLRFPLDSRDFGPSLAQITASDAQAIIVAFAFNTGVGFVTQWATTASHLPVAGINVSGQAFEYWNDTGGKVSSHIYADAATGATAVTPKTLPFFQSYVKRFKSRPIHPLFTGYTTYDAIYIIKAAIEQIGSPPPSASDVSGTAAYRLKLVDALEKTDYTGTIGRIRFQGKNDTYPHDPILKDDQGKTLVVPKWVNWLENNDRGLVWPLNFIPSDIQTKLDAQWTAYRNAYQSCGDAACKADALKKLTQGIDDALGTNKETP
jgi:branched-chain amino acid transport system substrate-binding protein